MPKRLIAAAIVILAGFALLSFWPIPDQPDGAHHKITSVRPLPPGRQQDRLFIDAAQANEAAAAGRIPNGTRSLLNVAKQMRHGDSLWNEKGIGDGQLQIWVHLDSQMISVFRGGHEIGTAVILFGGTDHDTPVGSFPIKAKSEKYRSRKYGAPMPYSLWLTDDGVALHGSKVAWGTATHGCVGVPIEFARKIFEASEPGDIVRIVGASG